MSAEDHKFVQLISSSVTHNRHCKMPLQLCNRNMVMPNNHNMGKQRVLNLIKKCDETCIAILANIEGMFHQDNLVLLQFLQWLEGDTTKNLEEYRMTIWLCGAISSPACATFLLCKTADVTGHKFEEEVSKTVKNNFYVDD